MGVSFDETFPSIRDHNDERVYAYMDLAPGQKAADIPVGYVFLGSCTNARLSDLQLAARIVKGRKIAEQVTAIVVPGSRPVKRAAEKLGLDKVPAGVHCASTSNRNFEDRQGFGAKTHLCSPAMAATAALYGRFVDTRQLDILKAGV